MTQPQLISHGWRCTQLAEQHPDKTAIIFVPQDDQPERHVTWRELDARANQFARIFQEEFGVDEHSLVVIGLWNCVEHYFAALATWKLGALTLPLRGEMPERERDQILELGKPKVVICNWEHVPFPAISPQALLEKADHYSSDPLPEKIPNPGYAMGSGGSTGRPKIIVIPGPYAQPAELDMSGWNLGFRPRQVQLVAGPLYHNSPYGFSHRGLFYDQTLVVMERFNAAKVIDAIEKHKVNWVMMAPTMMSRIVKQSDVWERDFSSFEGMLHTAAPCPEWLKRDWLKLLEPEKVWEAFGATEAVGATIIRGDEWLEHPGSVGKPINCALKILDPEGHEVATGEVGEIFMRPTNKEEPTYNYIGSTPAKTTEDGFVSVGDMGWVDAEGYLHPADRRVDMIITGGANVFPAEVEAALTEHPQIADVAVIGVPDDDWGKRVHAVIQPRDFANPPTVQELDRHVRDRLMSYKIPKSYEFIAELPRQPSGKIRRTDMVNERAAGWTAQMQPAKDPQPKV